MESHIENDTPIRIGDALRWMLLYIAVLFPPAVIDLLLLDGLPKGLRLWIMLALHALLQGLYLLGLMWRRGIRFRLLGRFTPRALLLALVGAAFCVIVVSLGVSPLLHLITAQSGAGYDRAVSPYVEHPIAGFLLICVLAPLVEELLARGFVLGGLTHRYGALRALLVSTVLFAAMHLNLMQAIAALVPGFVLGHLYLQTGSLMACVLMHGLYNAFSFFTLLLA